MSYISGFLKKYRIDEQAFKQTGLLWDDLLEIKKDFQNKISDFEEAGKTIVNFILKCEKTHSVKYRIKDPEHLLEKIIRKKIEAPDFVCSIDDYSVKINDLIGVRALHLFKQDWEHIHKYIEERWDLIEKPVANIRKGDLEAIIELYQQKGCDVKEHPHGYRSVHYTIQTGVTKKANLVEIQVRTLFEEGWSEISHMIRYPYEQNDTTITPYLSVFNSLAGSADEMGSYIISLKSAIDNYKDEIKAEKNKRREAEKKLNETIEELKISKEDKEKLKQEINKLSPAITILGSSDYSSLKKFGNSVVYGGNVYSPYTEIKFGNNNIPQYITLTTNNKKD